MSDITSSQKRAITAYASSIKRLGVSELVPPAFESAEDLSAFLDAIGPEFQKTKKRFQNELEVYKKAQSEAPSIGGKSNIWAELDRKVDRIEDMLRNPSTLKSRLDEGRRSMMPRISPRVAELVNVTLTETEAQYTAAIDSESLLSLKSELEDWAKAWMTYTVQWLTFDINRQIEYLWVRRDGSTMVEQPTIRPLEVSMLSTTFHAPSLKGEKDKASLAGGVYRNFRTILYGVMSFTFLFGLRGSGGDSGLFTGLMVMAGVVAVVYGFLQAKRDQERDGENLRAQLQDKAEREARDAVRIWLDRISDKMIQDVREQLHNRRSELFIWYRTSVVPQRDSYAAAQEQRKKMASEATVKIRDLEAKIRDLDRACQEYDRLKSVH